MRPVGPEQTPSPVNPTEGEPRPTANPGHRYATVDPDELQRWNRRLHEFCSDKFTPQGARS